MLVKKEKRNIWKDPSPYGIYEGEHGSPEQWTQFFKIAQEQFGFSKSTATTFLNHESAYSILGVENFVSQEQIKTAWRKLVLINHPDKGGNKDKFLKIMAAYYSLKED